jgi:hypothetical protein
MDSSYETARYREWAAFRLLPDVEDGSRLAPMHRFHDPGGALFATLPQWPRMNSKLVRSIDRLRTLKLALILHLWVRFLRHNPVGIRAYSGKFQAP